MIAVMDNFDYSSPFKLRQQGLDVELVQEMLKRVVTGVWSKQDEIAYEQTMRKQVWQVMAKTEFARDFLPRSVIFI